MAVDDLAFFRVVARSESLTAASRELGSSLPMVSRRLSARERRLEVRLVHRGPRRLRLTSEGELYAARAARILEQVDELDELVTDRSGRLRGSMVVEATPGFGRAHVAPLLGEFVAQHPDLDARLQLSALPPQPHRRAFDVAVHLGASPDSGLRLRRLARNRRVPCAAPSYLAERGVPRRVEDLAEHSCIVLRENDADYALWRFGDPERSHHVRVRGALSSDDGDVITAWALAGLGVIMRSEWQVRPHLEDGSLVRLLPDVPTPDADVFALLDAERHLPRRVEEFVDFLAERLPARV